MKLCSRAIWLAGAALISSTCGSDDDPPSPSFQLLFAPLTGELMTSSSPSLADLSGDGVPDIVFGSGVDRLQPGRERYGFSPEPEISGYVVAVSGATNEILWQVPNPRDAFTTPRFIEMTGDGVPDVIMGGREGRLTAFSGVDGTVIWRVDGAKVAETPFPYNFLTPAIIRDANDDNISDLVVLYGGDDTKPPNTPRDGAFLTLVSGADGEILAVHQTPDGAESYSSAVVYARVDGTEWVVFGTGGETHGGSAYRVPVAALRDGTFSKRVERLVEAGTKGVIAPPVVLKLSGDDEPDIVISTFDGRLIAVDGATTTKLWEQRGEGEESYHSPAVLRRTRDGRLAFFVSRGLGAFPNYHSSIHRLVDATDGRVLLEYDNAYSPAGAPLAVDLTGDGVDEPIFFTTGFPGGGQSARIHVLHLRTGNLINYDLPTIFATTPVIGDPRGTGTLEMIGLAWQLHGDRPATADSAKIPWQNLRWQLLRLDLSAPVPPSLSWSAYMGSASDGSFRPLLE